MEKITKCWWINLPLLKLVGIPFLVIGYFFAAQIPCVASTPTDKTAITESAGEGKGDDEAAVSNKKMGIEIETSAIKIESAGSDKIGFNILNSVGNQWIIVEEDTSDTTFGDVEGFESFNKNLECKTVGGLSKDSLIDATGRIQNILRELYTRALDKRLRVLPDMLKTFVGDETLNVVAHTDNAFFIKSKPEDEIIRPQITYQLPFEQIVRVFEHLSSLDHMRIKEFLDVLNPSAPLALSAVPPITPGMGENQKVFFGDKAREHEVKAFFKTYIAPVFSAIDNPKLKGFCCLFFYYWYELFNNKEFVSQAQEPGLKQFLGIMSRISFSELYDASLDKAERIQLRAILDSIVASHGAGFRLKAYKGYNDSSRAPMRIETGMTLAEWYHSIIGGRSARRSGADLLSPPPGMLGSDSMGAFDLGKSDSFPLIEVRGYASLKPELTISKTREFAEREANWFFNESK